MNYLYSAAKNARYFNIKMMLPSFRRNCRNKWNKRDTKNSVPFIFTQSAYYTTFIWEKKCFFFISISLYKQLISHKKHNIFQSLITTPLRKRTLPPSKTFALKIPFFPSRAKIKITSLVAIPLVQMNKFP